MRRRFLSFHLFSSHHFGTFSGFGFGFQVLMVDSHWARMMDTLFPLHLSQFRTLQGRTSNSAGIVVQDLRAAI